MNPFSVIPPIGVRPVAIPAKPLGLVGTPAIGIVPPNAKSPNYTDTQDPNVKIGKHGVKITQEDFENANKNGYAWKDLNAYADWLGGWAKKLPTFKKDYPYYRTYPNGKLSATDMALLEAKDDPKINAILQRNIAGEGQIPQYGENDSDYLKSAVKTLYTLK